MARRIRRGDGPAAPGVRSRLCSEDTQREAWCRSSRRASRSS